jgi:hypothetical protein
VHVSMRSSASSGGINKSWQIGTTYSWRKWRMPTTDSRSSLGRLDEGCLTSPCIHREDKLLLGIGTITVSSRRGYTAIGS